MKYRAFKETLKVGDIFIILLTLVVTILLFINFYVSSGRGVYLKVVSLESTNLYPLNEDRRIEVEGPIGKTEIIINGGEAWINNSPCREKICIKMGKIKRPGQQAVCVPNRVLIEVVGGKKDVDAVSY